VLIRMLTAHVSTDLVDEAHSVLLPLAQADDAAGAHAHACRPHRRQRREPVLRSAAWQEGIMRGLIKGRLVSATFARLTRRTWFVFYVSLDPLPHADESCRGSTRVR